MPSFKEIYAHHAPDYDRLVAREDYNGHILPALRAIRPLEGLNVVEFGAGTGRLTCLLAPIVCTIRAFDASPHMLSVAYAKLAHSTRPNWQLAVADNQMLPVAHRSADLAIAGWSFGHATDWHVGAWRDEVGGAIQEMRRVLRSGGTAIILETMGTGRETPQPPTPELAAFYRWLEDEQGFANTTIRTDYRFASQAEAEELTGFFFGSPMVVSLLPDGQVVLPECTGIWWLQR